MSNVLYLLYLYKSTNTDAAGGAAASASLMSSVRALQDVMQEDLVIVQGCFTSATVLSLLVQMYKYRRCSCAASCAAGESGDGARLRVALFTCFTSTKVHILTQKGTR